MKVLYLYGSCARGEQNYGSDVDLFLELQPDFDAQKYKDDVILLKGRVSPADMNMAVEEARKFTLDICEQFR